MNNVMNAPKTLRSIWSDLPSDRKLDIADAFWKDCNNWQRTAAVNFLAKHYNTRYQTIARWPVDRLGQKLVTQVIPESLIDDIFRIYFFTRQRKLMAQFLDALGIPNKDGSFSSDGIKSPERSRFRYAAQVLLRSHEIASVELYFDILIATDIQFWEHLQDVILEAGSLAVLQTLPPDAAPEPELEVVREDEPAVADSSLNSVPRSPGGHEKEAALISTTGPAHECLTSGELRSQLQVLCTRIEAVVKHVGDLGASLKSGKLSDGQGASETLSAYRTDLNRFHAELRETLTKLRLPADRGHFDSLTDAELVIDELAKLEAAKEAEAEETSQILAVLEDVIDIQHVDAVQFLPLLECQDKARALQTQVKSGAEHNSIRPELASFGVLVQLVTTEVNSEKELEAQFEAVTEAFGVKLAYAALRKKLTLLNYESSIPKPPQAVATEQQSTGTDSSLDQQRVKYEIHPTQTASSPSQPAADVVETAGEAVVVEKRSTVSTEPSPPVIIDSGGQATEAVRSSGDESLLSETPASDQELKQPFEVTDGTVIAEFKMVLGETAQSFAAEILTTRAEPTWEQLSRLAWLCLKEQNLGMAFRMFQAAEGIYPSKHGLHSSVVRALALAAHVSQSEGPIAQALREDLDSFTPREHHSANSHDRNECTLMMATLLRPSLVAPELDAADYLSALGIQYGEPALHKFSDRIAEYCANTHTPLDPIALKYLNDKSKWKIDCDRLRTEGAAWWIRASQFQFSYQGASRVWRSWLQPGNHIEVLLRPVIAEHPADLADLHLAIDRLSSDSRLRTEIDLTDRQLRKNATGRGINAVSFQVLRLHVHEAISFSRRWVDLQQARSHRDDSYHTMQIQKLRADLEFMMPGIRTALSRQRAFAPDDLCLQSALDCLRDYINSFLKMLSHGEGRYELERPTRYILNSDLLRIPGLQLDDEWNPVGCEQKNVAIKLIEFIANAKQFSWRIAFSKHAVEDRDHLATQRIIEFLELEKLESPQIIQELREERLKHLTLCREALLRDVSIVRKEVEHAAAFGLLTETQRVRHLETARSLEVSVESLVTFWAESNRINSLRLELQESRKAASELVREKMRSAGIDLASPDANRINAILIEGDILCANEYLDLIRQGQPLPDESKESDLFKSFFPNTLNEIEESVNENQPIGVLINKIEHGRVFAGIRFGAVPVDQRAETVNLISAWHALKRNKNVGTQKETLKTLLTLLGFRVEDLTDSYNMHRAWMHMRSGVITDRRFCPVPFFGSQANGNYRIFCIWDRPSEEQIAAEAGKAHEGSPVIVLYFGRLSEANRRHLAQICRTERKSFLLIDEPLIIFLCGQPGIRLSALFQCTLPFTHLNPYSTTASLVPPEMFYGRREERSQIMDPMGSCFIYGGRQLGKTALLLSVQREFHDITKDRIACWIDLKANGVIHEQIWATIARSLKDLKVPGLMEHLPVHAAPEKVCEEIFKWLSSNQGRRILLLLDEADRFLEADGSVQDGNLGFPHTNRLKNLMERTARRFKVVFAGLHNVQRTVRQGNQPLAHFGQAICIGPLLEKGEFREAKALIENPLGNLGFRFTSPDLVTRILSQTNFYPSLIQIYCNQLFLHLTRASAGTFDMRKSPPYLIGSKHVDDAYLSRDLRHAIQNRFELTLNLDARYRVLALIIALESGPGQQTTVLEGFDVSWIREQAISFWPGGFEDVQSEDDFRALLEEMEGLGILREMTHGRFALRTPNILSLLGSPDEIEDKLLHSMESEPPRFEPHVFRAAGPLQESWKRSPLTVMQESRLRVSEDGISVVWGTRAAGLDDLAVFVRRLCGDEYFITRGAELTSAYDFQRVLTELSTRERHGTTVLLISSESAWTDTWLRHAASWIKQLKQRRQKNSFIRLLFAGDPSTLWQLLGICPNLSEFMQDINADTLSLRPWHRSVLGQWLGECGIGTSAAAEQAEISYATGNWPYLLMNFKQRYGASLDWRKPLEELKGFVSSTEGKQRLLEHLGISLEVCVKVLRRIDQFAPVTKTDLSALLEDDIPKEITSRIITWADTLSLVRLVENHGWRVDPIVAKAIAE